MHHTDPIGMSWSRDLHKATMRVVEKHQTKLAAKQQAEYNLCDRKHYAPTEALMREFKRLSL